MKRIKMKSETVPEVDLRPHNYIFVYAYCSAEPDAKGGYAITVMLNKDLIGASEQTLNHVDTFLLLEYCDVRIPPVLVETWADKTITNSEFSAIVNQVGRSVSAYLHDEINYPQSKLFDEYPWLSRRIKAGLR
jgi:hypothetical protein